MVDGIVFVVASWVWGVALCAPTLDRAGPPSALKDEGYFSTRSYLSLKPRRYRMQKSVEYTAKESVGQIFNRSSERVRKVLAKYGILRSRLHNKRDEVNKWL